MNKFPATFSKYFDEEILAKHGATLIAIRPEGEILWLNRAWYDFARANEGESTVDRFAIGSNYFDGITSPMLRQFFEQEFGYAYALAQVFSYDYECSSPDRRRLFRMRALPIADGGLLLEHVRVLEEPIPYASAEADRTQYENEHGLITQCSNCRKVKRADGRAWDWVREWIVNPSSGVSHGLCDICFGYYWRYKLSTHGRTTQ